MTVGWIAPRRLVHRHPPAILVADAVPILRQFLDCCGHGRRWRHLTCPAALLLGVETRLDDERVATFTCEHVHIIAVAIGCHRDQFAGLRRLRLGLRY